MCAESFMATDALSARSTQKNTRSRNRAGGQEKNSTGMCETENLETLFAGRSCNDEFLQDVPLIGHLLLFMPRVLIWRESRARALFAPRTYRSKGQGSGLG